MLARFNLLPCCTLGRVIVGGLVVVLALAAP